jgi:hypothetical protein
LAFLIKLRFRLVVEEWNWPLSTGCQQVKSSLYINYLRSRFVSGASISEPSLARYDPAGANLFRWTTRIFGHCSNEYHLVHFCFILQDSHVGFSSPSRISSATNNWNYHRKLKIPPKKTNQKYVLFSDVSLKITVYNTRYILTLW